MRVDERHAVGRGILANGAARALNDRLERGEEARADEIRHTAHALAIQFERGMHVEARLPARAGRAIGTGCRMAVSSARTCGLASM